MSIAFVTRKGRISIPKPVRDGLGIEPGDRIEFIEFERGVYTVVAATRDVRDLKGMIPRLANPVTIEDMSKAIRRRTAR